MRRIRPNAWIFACASGVLQVLIFPKPALYLLSWVALAPLIYAILKCREQDVTLALADGGLFLAPATAWQGFLLGYVSGVIWYLGSCYWVFYVMHVYGGIGVATSLLLLLMYALYLALYHGLFGLLARPDRRAAQRIQPARAGLHPVRLGRRRTGAHLHHRISLGPAGHHADRQHSALARRHGHRRVRPLLRDCAGEYRSGSRLPGAARASQGLAHCGTGGGHRFTCRQIDKARGAPDHRRRNPGAGEYSHSRFRRVDARLPHADARLAGGAQRAARSTTRPARPD